MIQIWLDMILSVYTGYNVYNGYVRLFNLCSVMTIKAILILLDTDRYTYYCDLAIVITPVEPSSIAHLVLQRQMNPVLRWDEGSLMTHV